MYMFKVCTAVQHTNAIRITSLPDVTAFSPSTREMQHCITERQEGHQGQQRPDPPPWALALWMEGWLLARALWSAVCFGTGAVGLYSFLEQRERASEMPSRVLLLLKVPKDRQTESCRRKLRAQGQTPSPHTCTWLQTSWVFCRLYSLPLYFDFSIRNTSNQYSITTLQDDSCGTGRWHKPQEMAFLKSCIKQRLSYLSSFQLEKLQEIHLSYLWVGSRNGGERTVSLFLSLPGRQSCTAPSPWDTDTYPSIYNGNITFNVWCWQGELSNPTLTLA